MISGNPRDFLDTAYTGQDIVFSFQGSKYWFQGYCREDGLFHMEIMPYSSDSDAPVWEHDDVSMENCLEALQDDIILNNQSFWDIEEGIEWLDD